MPADVPAGIRHHRASAAQSTEIAIRPIRTAEELDAVERLRYRVYVEEMHKPYPQADHVGGRLTDPLDAESVVFAAFDNGRVMATLRCSWATSAALYDAYGRTLRVDLWADVPRHELAVCSRLVVAPGARKSRLAVSLMCAIYTMARARGTAVCLCSTTPPLRRFFERFGFRSYAEPFFDEDSDRLQWPLALLLEDAAHLRAVSSPFLFDTTTSTNPLPAAAWVARLGGAVPTSTVGTTTALQE